MDEPAVRIVLVVGFLLFSILGIVWMRRRSATPFETIRRTGLEPGIYFFSSAACAECGPARAALVDQVGESGFVEHSWESDPEILEALGVVGVPATLVVEPSGRGKLWTGLSGADVFAS